jgi:cytochrome c551/c552
MIKKIVTFMILIGWASTSVVAKPSGCLSCHNGIEDITTTPAMMALIKVKSNLYGDSGGCVICHGGNPDANTKEAAHEGSPDALKQAQGPQMFYSNPGSIWINQYTCGQSGCHEGYGMS